MPGCNVTGFRLPARTVTPFTCLIRLHREPEQLLLQMVKLRRFPESRLAGIFPDPYDLRLRKPVFLDHFHETHGRFSTKIE